MKKQLFALLFLITTACVGPMTPFGGLHAFSVVEQTDSHSVESTRKTPVQISFKPYRQVLHDKSDFIVEIKATHETPDIRNVMIQFNSLDLTKEFLAQAEIKQIYTDHTLQLNFKNLRLKITDKNQIKVFYKDKKTTYASVLKAPSCNFLENSEINNIQGFQPPHEYMLWLGEVSRRNKLNPSLLTGIVAQESGFNTKAVSWSKAMGLTQMTPLAEKQIKVEEKKWPQTRNISSINYLELKSKVENGEINANTDWRLNPRTSLQGGADYIQYLHNYWKTAENEELLKRLKGDSLDNFSKVILASYNSGPARVKNAIQSNGDNWLRHSELKEAHKYVNKVLSYCYHFSERSLRDDG